MQTDCFLKTLLTSASDLFAHRLRKNWSDEWDYWLDVMLVVTHGFCVEGVQTWDYACSDIVQGWVHYCSGVTVYTFVYTEIGGLVFYLLDKCHGVIDITIFVSAVAYVQCIGWAWVIVFYIPYVFSKSWFEVTTSLSHISFLAGITCDFVYATFFMTCYMDSCFESYELVQCCSSLERYAYIGVFKQISNFSFLGAMVSKCGPDLVVFLLGLCVTGLVLYLSVKFLDQLLWKIVIFSSCLYCCQFFFVFCLGPVVGNAF
jgi:hypothetical protein